MAVRSNYKNKERSWERPGIIIYAVFVAKRQNNNRRIHLQAKDFRARKKNVSIRIIVDRRTLFNQALAFLPPKKVHVEKASLVDRNRFRG